jgi:tetratricopeptide (TPR) repeat protein
MPKTPKESDATLDDAGAYVAAFTADVEGFTLAMRFVYTTPDHVVSAAEWFFSAESCPFRRLFDDVALNQGFDARLWVVSDGEVRGAVDLREHVVVIRDGEEPVTVADAAGSTDGADAAAGGPWRMVVAREDLVGGLPPLEGTPLAPGQRARVRVAEGLVDELREPLSRLFDRGERSGEPLLTYGPVDLETGLRIDGFVDPDPAPPGAPHAPLSLDELKERVVADLAGGDAERAAKYLARLERALTYPPYDLRAELELGRGSYEAALTNALLGLTPAPTEEQVDLLQRTFAAWIGQRSPRLESLVEQVERALAALPEAELFDLPQTIATALRDLLVDPPAARLRLLEAITAKDDVARLVELLDRDAESDAERPVVAASLLLLAALCDGLGDDPRALAALRRAHAATPTTRGAAALGLRLLAGSPGEALELIRASADLAAAPDGDAALADRLFFRYARLLGLEHPPLDTLLLDSIAALRRAGDLERALGAATALAERGHWLGRYHVGCLLGDLGRTEEAVTALRLTLHDWLERSRRRERHDIRSIRGNATYRLACAEAALGQHDLALQTLARACRLDETNQRRAREETAFLPLWDTTEFMRIAGGAGARKVDTIAVGATVRHAKFGDGTVSAVDGAGDAAKLTIEFPAAGTKKLLARFVHVV